MGHLDRLGPYAHDVKCNDHTSATLLSRIWQMKISKHYICAWTRLLALGIDSNCSGQGSSSGSWNCSGLYEHAAPWDFKHSRWQIIELSGPVKSVQLNLKGNIWQKLFWSLFFVNFTHIWVLWCRPGLNFQPSRQAPAAVTMNQPPMHTYNGYPQYAPTPMWPSEPGMKYNSNQDHSHSGSLHDQEMAYMYPLQNSQLWQVLWSKTDISPSFGSLHCLKAYPTEELLKLCTKNEKRKDQSNTAAFGKGNFDLSGLHQLDLHSGH